ncbi:MAG: hypothetical protein U0905_19430 [Pirellulales bacterium]
MPRRNLQEKSQGVIVLNGNAAPNTIRASIFQNLTTLRGSSLSGTSMRISGEKAQRSFAKL